MLCNIFPANVRIDFRPFKSTYTPFTMRIGVFFARYSHQIDDSKIHNVCEDFPIPQLHSPSLPPVLQISSRETNPHFAHSPLSTKPHGTSKTHLLYPLSLKSTVAMEKCRDKLGKRLNSSIFKPDKQLSLASQKTLACCFFHFYFLG
jgi:hypothetical protein